MANKHPASRSILCSRETDFPDQDLATDRPSPEQPSTPPSAADEALTRVLAMDPRMGVLRGTLLTLVRRDGRDLTARQLTAFLTVYMDDHIHTVSSMADLLNIARPGVTRILDRLVEFDMVSRQEDRDDRRRVLIRRTQRGAMFFQELVGITSAVAGAPGASFLPVSHQANAA
jgi:DNA-binding MarR family transcriptional regulator